MDFQWHYAQPYFAKLDSPGYGSREQWMLWYQKAWEYLFKAGLTQVETPLDDLRVRLRVLALCWLSHDYCAAVLGDEWSSCPYWEEWATSLDVHPVWAILTVTGEKLLDAIVAESGLSSSDNIWEEDGEGFSFDDRKINQDLIPRLVMTAVYSQRKKVIDALLEGFGGDGPLFVSMHVNCYSLEDVIEERRDELERELEDLEGQVEHEASEEVVTQLRRRIEGVRQQLDEEVLAENAKEELMVRLGEPLYLVDEESGERLNGCQWCNEGCPIVVRGEPEFYLPG